MTAAEAETTGGCLELVPASPTDLAHYQLEDDSAVARQPEDEDEEQPGPPRRIDCSNYVIKNSSGIHIGDRTYYTAPVTIKQFVVPGDEVQNGLDLPPGLENVLPVRSSAVLCPSPDAHRNKLWQYVGQWLKSPKHLAIAIFGAIVVIVAIFLVAFLAVSTKTEPVKALIQTSNKTFMIHGRSEWGAKAPKGHINKLQVTPVPLVVISHTGSSICSDLIRCAEAVRSIQGGATSSGFSDIPYNFLVGGDGYIYEGRGWDLEGAHTRGYNNCSIGISFIGNFNNQEPLKTQVAAVKNLIDEGVLLGTIDPDYALVGHRQLSKTQSPGTLLFNELKTWPHWLEDIALLNITKT